ncbi:MAG: 2-C-methyl-D-erythritol 4-phosphate cytidylyltransferase [Bordetella sp.]|nr:MAG: 2-C-methyl-D-erythritol 4-phosphate cytidylyltransferase [Bordetella sp.]
MNDSLIAIVPSAGIGNRASFFEKESCPKQYRFLAGIPVIRHTIMSLLSEPRIKHIFVSVAQNDKWAKNILKDLPCVSIHNYGGKTRVSTIINTIFNINIACNDWILIHDAVRPILPIRYLNSLIDKCYTDSVGGLLALQITDTIKNESNNRIIETIDRNHLWLAQTPQMFRAGILKKALSFISDRNISITDESSAVEMLGYSPLLIKGTLMNMKITWPEDFRLIEKWL